MNSAPIPAGVDPATGVASKDVVINQATGLWARVFLPPPGSGHHAAPAGGSKLPVVVYYHGGAFVLGSAAAPTTHGYLNCLVAAANVVAVAVEYRLAPEHPLPAAFDDSWEGLKWVVASHAIATATGDAGCETWLVNHGDFARVFLAGSSAGGTIAHAMAVRAGGPGVGISIRGVLVMHPFFSGVADIGKETTKGKAWTDAFWRFRHPAAPLGLDDPLANPFSEAAGGSAARVAGERVLVCVAEKDTLRDRGVWYYENLKASGYGGEVELFESMGEGHVFHCINPRSEKAIKMQERVVRVLRPRLDTP
ncbi:hypothetical protein BRADI_1g45945v3 [Brachypodium distachyon]|uniref:Alpha/beta hydrolase fold-3 domain-containing protein n=1 Tax=Brachypodium distachyon TaxID=15368 RepID=I1GZU1_BRADI|nr:hypothetical protein BRADI_1g45945v3 [Brachypodium distachyon]